MAAEATAEQKARMRLLENRMWVDANITELQKEYKNKWLIVREKKVQESGDRPAELKDKIDEKHADETLLVLIPNVIATPM